MLYGLVSKRFVVNQPYKIALLVLILVAPFAITLAWGDFFQDTVYSTLLYARNLSQGMDVMFGLSGLATPAPLFSPLYVVLLAGLERVGVSLLVAAQVSSALGWSVAALALFVWWRSQGRPMVAWGAMVLTATSPLVTMSAGSELSWGAALFWVAVALAGRERWRIRGAALALFLWLRFDWGMLFLVVLFLFWDWSSVGQRRLRAYWATFALLVLAWALTAVLLFGQVFWPPRWGQGAWMDAVQRLAPGRDLYWLFLPLAGLGLFVAPRRLVGLEIVCGLMAWMGIGEAAVILFWSIMLVMTALGAEYAFKWFEMPGLFRSRRSLWQASALCLLLLAPEAAQVISLAVQFRARPVDWRRVEQAAGDWLASTGEPEAVVLATARMGYGARRPTLVWNGADYRQADLAALLSDLNDRPPRYVASSKTLPWYWFTGTEWFSERYDRDKIFETSYDALSPLIIWRYRRSGFDLGVFHSLNLSLSDEIELVGCRYWPERLQPGEPIYATLFIQARKPPSEAFDAGVRVISPIDGRNWAQCDEIVPRSMPVDWWQPGQVIAERFVLTTTTETPVGAYHLDMIAPAVDVDGAVLGYVAVPWQGDMGDAVSINATLAGQVRLLAADVPKRLTADLEVTLYWEALRPPDDNWIVFVHLVDPAGQQAAGHDGAPMDGRYFTKAWRPGEVVPDTHRLLVDEALPAGTYRLVAGMYQWPSVERLPVWDEAGVEQADRVIVLASFTVR